MDAQQRADAASETAATAGHDDAARRQNGRDDRWDGLARAANRKITKKILEIRLIIK